MMPRLGLAAHTTCCTHSLEWFEWLWKLKSPRFLNQLSQARCLDRRALPNLLYRRHAAK